MNRIIVGVDTSDASIEAVRRAAEEARLRDATLEVVYAFHPPEQVTAFPVPPSKGRDQPSELEAIRAEYRSKLDDWLDAIDVDLDDLDVETLVVADKRPSRALVERSAHADLVVVGHRGRGGFGGLKLGSVSEQVTRHAHAPVLVIRPNTKG